MQVKIQSGKIIFIGCKLSFVEEHEKMCHSRHIHFKASYGVDKNKTLNHK